MPSLPIFPQIDPANGELRVREHDALKQTDAEIAAGVTPVNYAYRELDIKRYGALGDGVTNDSAAFDMAAQVAKQNGGTIVVSKPPVQYLLTAPWNLTNGDTVTAQRGIVVRGEGANYDNASSAHILIKHTGHAFDCAGTIGIRFYDLVVSTDDSVYPDVGIFLARMDGATNSQIYRFTNCTFVGKFSKCVVYNYGCEQSIEHGCTFYNNATDNDAKVKWITSHNILGLSSTFITIATGEQSTICHRHYGGDYFMNSTNGTADTFGLDNANHFIIRDSFVDCRGRSMFYVDATNGASSFARISGIDGENSSPLPSYGVAFAGAASTQTPTGWEIEHSYLPSTSRAIYAGANVVLDNFHVRNIGEASSKGLEATTVQGSTIDCNSLALVITNSKYNLLVGQSDGWTITNRTNDNWVDTRISNAWTPDTSALTISGALTITNAKVTKHGPLITVQTTMYAATSISCSAGTTLGGMPAGSTESALVAVSNQSTGIAIGMGHFTGLVIKLPAISVGANVPITITANYFIG